MTLPELLVAAALGILMAAALFTASRGARPLAARSALDAVDAALGYARALASAGGNGATIVFAPHTGGFSLELYRGRPNAPGALTAAMPPLNLEADVREATLGVPPFTVFLDGAGRASAKSGAFRAGSMLESDPGCPAGRRIVLKISDPRSAFSLALACRPS